MAGVVDWAVSELRPVRLFLVGHSFGGQTAGLLDNGSAVDGMVTMSAQSGYWGRQGGVQKLVVFLHAWLSLPLLPRIFGFMPMRRFGLGEDLPRGVALEWGRWCRNPDYLLGDSSLPLDRYASFTAPVLAYSFGDDAWGTRGVRGCHDVRLSERGASARRSRRRGARANRPRRLLPTGKRGRCGTT